MLKIENLSRSFGGVHAVQGVSFEVPQGVVYSVIGPNGAGKTTLFNLITGIYTPTTGTIALQGENVGGMAPNALAARRMSRTFQNLQVCMNLSAVENVMIGAHLRLNSRLFAGMVRWPGLIGADRTCRERAEELMAFVGCEKYIGLQANSMPYGALKRLEIARALAADPVILLLDEPAAGLNNTETHEVEQLIRKLADSGITIVLVEHDMKLVMNISDSILVLNYGKKLAEGLPEDIRTNPEVITAYLGGEMEGA